MKVRKAIDAIMPPIYKMSLDVFVEARQRFQAYKVQNGIPEKDSIPQEVTDGIVQTLFMEKMEEIEKRSLEIGRRAVRDFNVGPALEAWIFSRKNIIKNKGMLQGVPIVWRGVDDYFKKFLTEEQMVELAADEDAEDRKTEVQKAVAEGKPIPPPPAILSFQAGLDKIKSQQPPEPAAE